MSKCIMNILCATDRNFLYPTYVTMQSIIYNHENVDINFYLLLSNDVSVEEKNKLKNFIEKSGKQIVFLYVNDEDYNNYVTCERFNKVAYFRLMAHQYLPQTMNRILYLDVDIIVDKNIYNDFYNLDFNDKYLIATSHNPNPDFCNSLSFSTVNLESAARGEYFNSGVLLMNLEKFRKNITMDDYNKAYESCIEKGIKVFYDQGLLNYMFFDKTLYLSSMDYNFRYSIPKDYKKRLIEGYDYKKSIIHFTGMKQPYKPWDLLFEDDDIKAFKNVPYEDGYFYVSKELNELMKKWWFYAEQTPIYENVYNEMCLKRKWFKRNLMDFFMKHNEMFQIYKSTSPKIVKDLKTNTTIITKYPDNFHYRAYKIICILFAPYFKFKQWLTKKKKRK